MSNNSNSNSKRNNTDAAAVVGVAAIAAGGVYLLSKLFGSSKNKEEERAQTTSSSSFPSYSTNLCVHCRKETIRSDRIFLICKHMIHQDCYEDLCERWQSTCPIRSCGKPLEISCTYKAMDQHVLDNRANQLNPNHAPTGPGRPARYPGTGTPADLNNHANQLNPYSDFFQGRRRTMYYYDSDSG